MKTKAKSTSVSSRGATKSDEQPKLGRKTLLDSAVSKEICAQLREGKTTKAACVSASLGERTYFDWMKKGEQEDSGIYFTFFSAVTRAREEFKAWLLDQFDIASKGDWRAIAWRLERQFPKEFGPAALKEPEPEMNNQYAPTPMIVNVTRSEQSDIQMGMVCGDPEAPRVLEDYSALMKRIPALIVKSMIERGATPEEAAAKAKEFSDGLRGLKP